jgi:molecular chaperone GrpE
MNQEQPNTETTAAEPNDIQSDGTADNYNPINADSEDLDAMTTPSEESTEKQTVTDTRSEADDYKEQLLRTLAEFENYKKRTQKEISSIITNANEKLITELLPIVDDMERSLKAAAALKTEDAQVQHFLQGFELIYNKYMQTFQRRGLKPMVSVGQELNVDFHDALMQVEKADTRPNIILEEYEKGYLLNDKVIRHAKVIVSK